MKGAKKARKDLPAVLMEFNKKYGSPERPFIAVVEGGDEPYYRPRIASNVTSGKGLEFINSDGRDNVVNLSDCILSDTETYDDQRFLFFVDRDYSWPDDKYKGYITSRHSVENFYTCQESFVNIIRIGFKLTEDEDAEELASICRLYRKWYLEISEVLQEFHAWLIFQTTEARDVNGSPPRLNLREIKIKDLVDSSFDGEMAKFDLKFRAVDYSEIFPYGCAIADEKLSEIRELLKVTDPFLYFRGKFALDFMVNVLNYLREDGRCAVPKLFSKKRNFHLPFSSNLVSEYVGYAETPACLVHYLKRSLTTVP